MRNLWGSVRAAWRSVWRAGGGDRRLSNPAAFAESGVFISYRREDCSAEATAIHGAYCALFDPETIFLDTETIRPGEVFPATLRERVNAARVVVVLIGPDWPMTRLHHPRDWVRIEISLALKSNALVIPVLVRGAAMPKAEDLPKSLQGLALRNAHRLSADAFDHDVSLLLQATRDALGADTSLKKWREASLLGAPIGAKLIHRLIQSMPAGETIDLYGDKGGWTSQALNTEILERSLNRLGTPSVTAAQPWYAYAKDAPDERRAYAIHRKLRAGAVLSNDRKIRLASDLAPGLSAPATLQETDYVSSLMTDQLAFVRVFSDETILFHETDGFLHEADGSLRLARLSESCMSNQLGVSTLAFTTDGYLVFVEQTAQNAQSAGTLAPSGSGSLDWADIAAGGDDLLRIVRFGGARELLEECGLQGRIDAAAFAEAHMQVYAFARMIHRGGKPEFFCVARLPLSAAAVHAARPTKHERQFTERSLSARARRIAPDMDVREEIVRLCGYYSSADAGALDAQALQLSYPLHHGLDLLRTALSQDTSTARQLAEFVSQGMARTQ